MFDHESVVSLALRAGQAILEVYNDPSSISVTTKDDNSPLTEADLAAHEIIVKGLSRIDPGTPIVSEEGRLGDPTKFDTCWLVDPLDGTKEFVKRNGMFTVNIALMARREERWTPLFGVVNAPVSRVTWFGGVAVPAERRGPDGSGGMAVRPNSTPEGRFVWRTETERCVHSSPTSSSSGTVANLWRSSISAQSNTTASGIISHPARSW